MVGRDLLPHTQAATHEETPSRHPVCPIRVQVIPGVDTAVSKLVLDTPDALSHLRKNPALASRSHSSRGQAHTSFPPSKLGKDPSSSITDLIFLMSPVPAPEAFQRPRQAISIFNFYAAPCSSWLKVHHQGSDITEEGTEAHNCPMSHKEQWQRREKILAPSSSTALSGDLRTRWP